jgi:hypothetical protein
VSRRLSREGAGTSVAVLPRTTFKSYAASSSQRSGRGAHLLSASVLRRDRSNLSSSRVRKFVAVAIAVLIAAVAACGGSGGNGDDEATELTGLIVDVQGRGNDVRSFTLQTPEGEYRLRIAPDVDYGFQLGHLRAHENSLLPVRCTLQRRAGGLYVLEIADA